MAVKIFNRTITTAIANNKFREASTEKSAEEADVQVKKPETVNEEEYS